ncbi:Arginine-tRNA-protein transferase, putative [Acanthamoeba castellanii str. Neff]|uniref:Arginine-tRNA-protein transferase, putative n=1 Tax=Acanthamoeba castellanii (strain ATCC 30010 / Neff) TaxID=1257118 RepID=L8HHK6_ACACF|nr:Arginine-tRNA-protein transferase, putative [Acanthamoeba castellanii str. Neff]ELR24682.1 Arginine-tRNA-protein transferase, putative [Acanthamoeba castellanii str. Neff]
MGGGRSPDRGSSSGSVTERTDRLTAAYAWQEPQVVEEPDFDPSIDAPFLEDVPHSPTIVSPYGEHGGRCGYCNKSATGRISWGMTAIKVRIDDYEAMQDLGWTRSGTWIPQYVIRLDVAKFVASKEQKHVLAKMERFLSDINNTPENFRHHQQQHGRTDANAKDEHERGRESEGESEDEVDETSVTATQPESVEPQLKDNDDALKKALLADIVRKAVRRCVDAGEIPAVSGGDDVEVAISAAASERERKRRGDYSSNVALKLLALYKHSDAAKSEAKATERAKDDDEVPREECVEASGSGGDGDGAGHDRSQVVKKPGKENTKEKKNETRRADAGRANEIAVKLLAHVERVLVEEESAAGVKQLFGDEGVRVVVAGPWINFFAQSTRAQHQQRSAQGTRGSRKAKKQQSEPDAPSHGPPIPHQFEMEIRPSQYTEESYLLYRKYTMQIHAKEEASEKSYTDFLCSTPLFDDPQGREDEALPPSGGYGSFHQYYRLDGKLIAVGVLDVLHSCLTSVYFFYDPDYAFLSLGVYSALKEIEWVQQTSLAIPRFKYYYMAYYIYDCPKMNYKAKYRPSDLMCPFYREWVPLEECIPRFQASAGRFTALVEREEPPPQAERLPIDYVPVLYEDCLVGFSQIGGRLRARVQPLVEQWCALVTADIASRVVLSIRRR